MNAFVMDAFMSGVETGKPGFSSINVPIFLFII